MSNPTRQQTIEAIKKCRYRKSIQGADVCSEELTPCAIVIDGGRCDALIQLYHGKSKTDLLVEQIAKQMWEES